MVNIENVTRQVCEIAAGVAGFIRDESRNFDFSKIEFKGRNDLVSYVDKQAEKRLTQSLMKILPDAGFIAEEGTGKKNEDGMNWVIDPLDGTTNFMHGLPPYSISIGLLSKEEIISGVIYDIPNNNCYWASKESKSYCDGREISVSQVGNFRDGLYITGYPYRDFDKYRNFYEMMYYFLGNTHGLRRFGSAAIDLAYVASGKSEGFFEFFLNPWDVAAGSLLVKQAGGIVTDFSGSNNYLFGKELIAGNAHVQAEMQKVILDFWKRKY